MRFCTGLQQCCDQQLCAAMYVPKMHQSLLVDIVARSLSNNQNSVREVETAASRGTEVHCAMQIDKAARWGDLESDEEESSEEEEEEEEDEDATVRGDDEESLADGLASVGGVSSLPSGLETPEVIDLRKAKAGGMLCGKRVKTHKYAVLCHHHYHRHHLWVPQVYMIGSSQSIMSVSVHGVQQEVEHKSSSRLGGWGLVYTSPV